VIEDAMPATPAEAAAARPVDARAAWAELDQMFHAAEGQLTQGSSPLALWLAWVDWSAHMANAPFRRAELATDAVTGWLRLISGGLDGRILQPAPDDHRFANPAWEGLPYRLYEQAFLLAQDLVDKATTPLPGVSPGNARLVRFAARQALDALSPSNIPWANPEVVEATVRSRGANLKRGVENWRSDLQALAGQAPEDAAALKVGRDLAVTPGEVVFRNDLIELIQYAPQTETVRAEPILIVPAWIMKYYILDLTPHDSLISHLVGLGHTVFCISWRNPGPDMARVGFDDYRQRGVMAALDQVAAICPRAKIHAVGYCLGGTLLAVAAAAMARDGDDRLASLSLFCAQTDFTEAGELQLFTTEEQVAFLEDVMAGQGYLDGRQMGASFELLRARDLIWSRMIKTYMLGEREESSALMTWNADATRMPARMHAEYLRWFFLDDDLAEGRLQAGGRPVSVGDIRAPAFVVATRTDHVAPWRSVHKIHLLHNGEVTFLLTAGGHNAGIVSPPGHPHRDYEIHTRAPGEAYLAPDAWRAAADKVDGSWWPAWTAWLAARSGPADQAPPAMPLSLAAAPGTYVMER
jgi:polyhydroxyalkanoate synthase